MNVAGRGIAALAWRAVVALALMCVALQASAAWWEFGRQDDEPVITDLKLNSVDASRLVDHLVLNRDDLVGGAITVRGRADVRTGRIGIVEYTLDGGHAWAGAELGDRGIFTFVLRPEFEREYSVGVRALTTAGRSTRLEDHSFKLEVKAVNTTDAVRRAFLTILDAYRNENLPQFMRLVSEDFEGDTSALDDAVRADFRNFDNIRIEPNIARITALGNAFDIYFTFNRQVYAVRNGRLLRDSAASIATFKREGQTFKLTRLAAPLIFGVSSPSDVATTVTAQSVGQQVITVNASTGTASTAPQPAAVPASSTSAGSTTLDTGTRTLNFSLTPPPPPPPPGVFNYQSFEFAGGGTAYSGNNTNPSTFAFQGDLVVAGGAGNLFFKSSVKARTCGTTFAALTQAPTTGYTTGGGAPLGPVAGGQCYVFQLVGPKYAAIEILTFSASCPAPPAVCTNSTTFRYKLQNDGTTSLQ